jgi:hypothetical protein
MSINALLYESAAVKNVFLTQENIVLDPLQVLRCDTRVFRYVFCIRGIYICTELAYRVYGTFSLCNMPE